MRAIFLIRNQPLICFSRSIALDILEAFKVCEAIEFVCRGEAGSSAYFVLAHSADQIVCNARVECFGPVRHDVDKVCFRWRHTL